MVIIASLVVDHPEGAVWQILNDVFDEPSFVRGLLIPLEAAWEDESDLAQTM
jgi:hypothetical protein